MDEHAQFVCEFCGEEIDVQVDVSAGASQQYVEDCPVCCNPHVITVQLDCLGQVQISGKAVQDHS